MGAEEATDAHLLGTGDDRALQPTGHRAHEGHRDLGVSDSDWIEQVAGAAGTGTGLSLVVTVSEQ
nr:hypothetical protein GCM10023233_07730 [Brevibacterium otitidis]